jgi:hypothetical protein
MEKLQTRYGELAGVVRLETWPDGTPKSCTLDQPNTLALPCGTLTPQYGDASVRRKYNRSLSFYESGALRSVSLEAQTAVRTPLGDIPAELVTFYESGEPHRVFPLNGQLSGYWTEQDEAALSKPLPFSFPFGRFTAHVIGLCFYKSGALRSLTLWPGEKVRIVTPAGEMPVHIGFSLYEDGQMRRPSRPSLRWCTRAGRFLAFDAGAMGLNADRNSLAFDRQGRLTSLASTHTGVLARHKDGHIVRVAPAERFSPLDEDATIIEPITVSFTENAVRVKGETEHVFSQGEWQLEPYLRFRPDAAKCASALSCAGCGKCAAGCAARDAKRGA